MYIFETCRFKILNLDFNFSSKRVRIIDSGSILARDVYSSKVRPRGGGENRPWAYLGKKIGTEYMKKSLFLSFSHIFRHCFRVLKLCLCF